MRSKIGAKSGSSSGRPLTLDQIWIPVAPRVMSARSSSASAASGLFIGSEATKPGKRSGCLTHSSAMPSLPIRASSGVSFGPPSASIGGEHSVSTCTYSS